MKASESRYLGSLGFQRDGSMGERRKIFQRDVNRSLSKPREGCKYPGYRMFKVIIF